MLLLHSVGRFWKELAHPSRKEPSILCCLEYLADHVLSNCDHRSKTVGSEVSDYSFMTLHRCTAPTSAMSRPNVFKCSIENSRVMHTITVSKRPIAMVWSTIRTRFSFLVS